MHRAKLVFCEELVHLRKGHTLSLHLVLMVGDADHNDDGDHGDIDDHDRAMAANLMATRLLVVAILEILIATWLVLLMVITMAAVEMKQDRRRQEPCS